MKAAHAFAEIYPRLTPVVRDGELIVGARVRGSKKDGGWNWYPDGFPEYVDGFAKNAPPDRPDIQAMAKRGLLSPQGSLNHKVVDYAGFIRTGSDALARRARSLAESCTGPERDFALAFALGHEAVMAHAQTYARACRELAKTAEPGRAAELAELARICEKVPALPAETFHEALQGLWLAYMVAGDGTGRIDVYLNDFYQADLAADRITPERAQELIECFMVKLHGDTMEGVVNVSSVQTLTLGGLLPDGTDGTNDLTRLFLAAIHRVRLLRPTVYVRCHEKTPEDVLEQAVRMLGDGLAEPNFYGDRPIVEGLTRIGVPVEVARDYALSGCTEVVSPGRGNWGAPNGWINLSLVVDEALREYAALGGRDAAGAWDTIRQHIEAVAEVCRVCNVWVDERCQQQDTRYGATLLMPVCLNRCRDIIHGGAETHFGHWEAMGLPNAADMILAAERLAFAAGERLSSLFARLDAGDPALFHQLRSLPKFGNDHAEVDAIADRLVRLLADALERRSTPFRTALVLGHLAGGENMHIAYGLRMGPTLDGRARGQTLADSLAGSQGQTVRGPTAVIQSLCRLDHSRLIAGNISTLRLNPADFATPDARRNVVALIRSFVAMGGSQLQVNLVDTDTLRKAQAQPEAYRGLLVRVAGYSADFTQMGRRLQDEIISRTDMSRSG
jgi:formate C-acetyltransferase